MADVTSSVMTASSVVKTGLMACAGEGTVCAVGGCGSGGLAGHHTMTERKGESVLAECPSVVVPSASLKLIASVYSDSDDSE